MEYKTGRIVDVIANVTDECRYELVVKRKRKTRKVAVALQRSGQLFFVGPGVVDPGAPAAAPCSGDGPEPITRPRRILTLAVQRHLPFAAFDFLVAVVHVVLCLIGKSCSGAWSLGLLVRRRVVVHRKGVYEHLFPPRYSQQRSQTQAEHASADECCGLDDDDDESPTLDIRPDYHRTYVDVLHQLTIEMLLQCDRLDLLSIPQ